MNHSRLLLCAAVLTSTSLWIVGCDKPESAPPPAKSAVMPSDPATTSPSTQSATTPPTNTKCPISGDPIDPRDTSLTTVVYKGKTYAFCCDGCKPTFLKDPEKAIASLASGQPQEPSMGMGKK